MDIEISSFKYLQTEFLFEINRSQSSGRYNSSSVQTILWEVKMKPSTTGAREAWRKKNYLSYNSIMSVLHHFILARGIFPFFRSPLPVVLTQNTSMTMQLTRLALRNC